jgi:hypothetical protein
LLHNKTCFQFATCARNPDAIQRTKSNFTSCSGNGFLDFATKFRELDFFCFRIADDGNGRAALCAELLPASLIHSIKSP